MLPTDTRTSCPRYPSTPALSLALGASAMATATNPAVSHTSSAAITTGTGPVISERVRTLKASVTVAFMNRAKAMQRQGIDVLSFAAGEPDFDTPHQVKVAAEQALEKGMTK